MSCIAILNSRRRFAELVRSGNVPLAVGTRSGAVAVAAEACGVPAVLSDSLWTTDQRTGLQNHVDDLVRRLAGDDLPAGEDYRSWGWWALEWPLALAFSHGARTRRLVRAAAELAPRARGVVHDAEGYVQGAVVNLAARELGLEPRGLAPSPAEAMTTVQDVLICPHQVDGAAERWVGSEPEADTRPAVVVLHADESGQVFRDLERIGARHFRLVMDARRRWRDAARAAVNLSTVDATPLPGAPLAPLVAPRWPRDLATHVSGWERELASHLFVTWQPLLRETVAWAAAAYGTGRVRALLGAGDVFPHMRCRLLACRRLGVPTLLLQQRTFSMHRAGGRGDRNHAFAEHSLVWSREAARDLARWGRRRSIQVVGWPDGSVSHAAEPVQGRSADTVAGTAARPWVVLTTTPHSDNAEVAYDQGEVFLRDVLFAVRAVSADAPIVVRCHPRENPARVQAFCTELGHRDVTVVKGGDLGAVVAGAAVVVSAKSTAALAALALGARVIVYHPAFDAAWFDRFANLPVARSRAGLDVALRGGLPARGHDSALSYARPGVHTAARVAAALRGAIRGTVTTLPSQSSSHRAGRYSDLRRRGAMALEVGPVLGVIPVSAAGGEFPGSAVAGQTAQVAQDGAGVRAAGGDVVELSTKRAAAPSPTLVGQSRSPELQLDPARLRAMVSRNA